MRLALAVSLAALAAARAAGIKPKVFTFRVEREFAHDTSAFTEGLVFNEATGRLLESTGLTGRSLIREFEVDMDASELRHVRDTPFPSKHFGEGITFWDGALLSLTWKSGSVHLFDRHELGLLETLALDADIHEGWGLTPASEKDALLASDGSAVLHRLERRGNRVAIADNVPVRDCANDMPYVEGINELELVPRAVTHPEEHRAHEPRAPAGAEEAWLRGAARPANATAGSDAVSDLVWGNIITTMCVAAINPRSGDVEAWILLDGIYDGWDRFNKVANGIAYRAMDDTLWLTGKDWSKLFQIELVAHPDPESVDVAKQCATKWHSFSYDTSKAVGRSSAPCN